MSHGKESSSGLSDIELLFKKAVAKEVQSQQDALSLYEECIRSTQLYLAKKRSLGGDSDSERAEEILSVSQTRCSEIREGMNSPEQNPILLLSFLQGAKPPKPADAAVPRNIAVRQPVLVAANHVPRNQNPAPKAEPVNPPNADNQRPANAARPLSANRCARPQSPARGIRPNPQPNVAANQNPVPGRPQSPARNARPASPAKATPANPADARPQSPARRERPPSPKPAANPRRQEAEMNPIKGPHQKDEKKTDEQALLDKIQGEIIEGIPKVTWEDVGGLEDVKQALRDCVVNPLKRPDIFVGIRAPAKGLPLFGPPGNGKTMIARAVASQANCTFFNITAASLTSKAFGEGEKLVKALFKLAQQRQPSIIFIDEIDSLLSARSDREHDAMRRMKTEFLVQMDGVGSSPQDHIFVMGATNRPFDIDEAARRRLVHRIYVPLPDYATRTKILQNILRPVVTNLSEHDYASIANNLEGYSGSDIATICKDAAFVPIREIGSKLDAVSIGGIRPLQLSDFESAIKKIRPSVDPASIERLVEWDREFGQAK